MKTTGFHQSKEGSALAIAMILMIIVAAIVGSYLKVSSNELKMADRSFVQNALLNTAESGADDAAWSLKRDDWTGWTQVGNTMVKKTTGFELGNGQTTTAITFVYDYDGYPVVFTEGSSTGYQGDRVVKQVRMELSHRSFFANGMTARDSLTFSGGNAYIDSYDSRDGAYNYLTNSNDEGSAGSISVEVDSVDIGNSSIRGYVATGGSDPNVGPNGRIWGDDSTLAAGENIDWDRVSTDFYADFPDVDPPTGLTVTATSLNVPAGSTVTIGTTGTEDFPEVYDLTSLNVGSNDVLEIAGNVILITSGDSQIRGEVRVVDGGKVTWYTEGDLSVGGNGIANATNVPENFVIYGTNGTDGETEIKLHGNGYVTATVYAPHSNISLKGGGNYGAMFGAVVGNQIQTTGNYSFHYDEALEDFAGDSKTYRVDDWREMYAAGDRLDFEQLYEDAITTGTLDLSAFGARYSGYPSSSFAYTATTETTN